MQGADSERVIPPPSPEEVHLSSCPNDLVVNSVVRVPQYVSHTAEAFPINARTKAIPIISQANRSHG
jgi:hypothetical protein